MRGAFCDAMVEVFRTRPYVFFTGDLGYMALEPLQSALGERFINAGVAEQNMITVAAGVASLGEQCWTYSIAPFIYARPFEQIRNDVCLHDFNVKMVGNGGGYGYGVMGGTHHALEDYGVLLTLQNMRAYVPAFAADLGPVVRRLADDPHPAYLRLGRDELPRDFSLPDYAPWRRLLRGETGVLIVLGPNAGSVLAALGQRSEAERPSLWIVSELPLRAAPLPDECRDQIVRTGVLFVLEEHVVQGSFGQMLTHALMAEGVPVRDLPAFRGGRVCVRALRLAGVSPRRVRHRPPGRARRDRPPDASMIDLSVRKKADALQGPVLILGASGFIGANLFRTLLAYRSDVFGTSSQPSAWRLEGVPAANIVSGDLLIEQNVTELLDTVRPRTVFNCIAHGAYSFETNFDLIYRTNVDLTARLIEELSRRGVHRYVHAGSSSEYGDEASGPPETTLLQPNSHYSVSKGAAAGILHYAGKKLGFPGVNLRLYAVYGPFEDSSRLVPAAVLKALRGDHTSYVDPSISRDFLYVDDCCSAFIDAALHLPEERFGDSYNIGSGTKTTIGEFAQLCKELFDVPGEPSFTMPNRKWDLAGWYADPSKARTDLGWQAKTDLRDGLRAMADWCRSLESLERYERSSKRFGPDETFSVSAIVACYKDGQAIPIMYERLKQVFEKLNVGHEIIFVNDSSPDQSEEAIRAISARRQPRDRRVALAEFRFAIGLSQRHGDRHQERLRSARRRLAGSAGAHRAVCGEVARRLRRGLWAPGEARGGLVYGARIQAVLPRFQPVLLREGSQGCGRFLPDGSAGGPLHV